MLKMIMFCVIIPGLVDGYETDKTGLDESVRLLEDKKEMLVVELEHTKARLQVRIMLLY